MSRRWGLVGAMVLLSLFIVLAADPTPGDYSSPPASSSPPQKEDSTHPSTLDITPGDDSSPPASSPPQKEDSTHPSTPDITPGDDSSLPASSSPPQKEDIHPSTPDMLPEVNATLFDTLLQEKLPPLRQGINQTKLNWIVCTMMYREPFFVEWIVHHLVSGVSHIYLAYLGSVEEERDLVRRLSQPFVDSGRVTILYLKEYSRPDYRFMCASEHQKEAEFLSIQDVDEYFVSPEGVVLPPILHDIVHKHPRRVGGIEVPGKILWPWSWFKTPSPPTNLEPLACGDPLDRIGDRALMGGDGYGYQVNAPSHWGCKIRRVKSRSADAKTIYFPDDNLPFVFKGVGAQHFCHYCDEYKNELDVITPSGVVGGIDWNRCGHNMSGAYNRLYYLHAYHRGSMEGMAVKWLHGEGRFTDGFAASRSFMISGKCTHVARDKALERVLEQVAPLMKAYWTPQRLKDTRRMLEISIIKGNVKNKGSRNLLLLTEKLRSNYDWDEEAYLAELRKDGVTMEEPNGLAHWINTRFSRAPHWKKLGPNDKLTRIPSRMAEPFGNVSTERESADPLLYL